MLINEIIRVALGAIAANKMRSFLTMLGIIIGIAAVITMVSLGQGAQRDVQRGSRRWARTCSPSGRARPCSAASTVAMPA
jgi:hypothetical protein